MGVNPWITGIILTVFTALVILGGIKVLAELLIFVPIMADFLCCGWIVIIVINVDLLPLH